MRLLILLLLLYPAAAALNTSEIPGLVYVHMEHPVINVTDSQLVRLDARNEYIGVYDAMITVESPQGETREEQLQLVKGNEFYGTWEHTFEGFMPGRHIITTVTLTNALNEEFTYPVEDRAFYVKGEEETVKLGLVYTTLDANRVNNDTPVTVRLDARDSTGITFVSAIVNNNRTIAMERVDGDQYYGTYEGTFVADEPDTTMNLTHVTLANARDNQTFNISQRSVYVEAIPYVAPPKVEVVNETTEEMGWTLEDLRTRPLAPTLLAFSVVLFVLLLLLLIRK